MQRRAFDGGWWTMLILSLVLGGASLGMGCQDDGEEAPFTRDELLAPGGYPVGQTTLTLVDESRPTWGPTDASDLPSRTLVTEVFYPAASAGRDAAPAGGPYPLVLYAHGLMGGRENNAMLAQLLASHGLVVAAPDFPRTHMGTEGGIVFEDSRFQAGDVRFVIDALQGQSETAGEPFHGLLEERVVLLGYSLGAYTSTLAGFHPLERHPAVEAVILLAGSACFIPDNTFEGADVPLLIIHGDRDAIIPYENGPEALFAAAGGDRWLLTLRNGTHTGFVDAMADLLDGLAHADSIGCSAISGQIPDPSEVRSDYTSWWLGMGGMPLLDDCSPACGDPSLLVEGLSPLLQVEILDLATRAFLLHVLSGDRRALQFLETDLAAAYPDVTIQKAP